jgi:predicted molibdopterin-dependent oxidoreductase YjgC
VAAGACEVKSVIRWRDAIWLHNQGRLLRCFRLISEAHDDKANPSVDRVRGSRVAGPASNDEDWVTVESRRDRVTLRAMVVKAIRPDTVFIPYHWPGIRSANRLTHRTLDPRSKIPEFKVSACRIAKASSPDMAADDRGPERNGASRGDA